MKYDDSNSLPFDLDTAKAGDRVLISETRLYGGNAGRPCVGVPPGTPIKFVKAFREDVGLELAGKMGFAKLVQVKHGQWSHMVWASDLRSPKQVTIQIDTDNFEKTMEAMRANVRAAKQTLNQMFGHFGPGGIEVDGGYVAAAKSDTTLPFTSGESIVCNKRPEASRLKPFDSATAKPGDKLWVTAGFESKTEFMFIAMDSGTVITRRSDSTAMSSQYRSFAPQFLLSVKPEPVEHVVEGVVFVPNDKFVMRQIIDFHSASFLNDRADTTRRAVDAMVTDDGLVLVKYIDEPVESAALVAAYKNPTANFVSNKNRK